MERLCDLENRVDQESVIQLGLLLAEENQHFLAQLLLHGLGEVVKHT